MIRCVAHLAALATTLLSGVLLCGCASVPQDVSTSIPASNYASTFEAAKATLRDYRFVIERVDARAGVITTRSKPTAGLITPWDKEQSTTRQELEELINQEVRTVRVEFVPVAAQAGEPATSPRKATLTPADEAVGDLIDLRDGSQDLQCRVVVAVERLHRPGRLLSTKTIRGTRNYEDPELNRRGLAPLSAEPLGRDVALEQRLIEAIQKRAMNSSPTANTSTPQSAPNSASTTPPANTPLAPTVPSAATSDAAPSGEPGFAPPRIEPVEGSR
jgi:hypothetical protein